MTDLTRLLAQIQNPETSHVDMVKRRAKGTLQWFLEKDCKTHPIHDNNHLEFLIGGEEGFAAIDRDLRAATSSIDLVLWGFDPGMELVRNGNCWPRGQTYGDLLSAKGREGVKVRLLIWYAGDLPLLNLVANGSANVPDIGPMSGWSIKRSGGKVVAPAPSTGGPSSWTLTDRSSYCRAWWNEALHGGFPNLEVRLRRGHPAAVQRNAALYLPSAAKSFTERGGMAVVATHHQKPILIDYEPGRKFDDSKPNTCAYVMGLNSITDFWDTASHRFNEPLREVSPAWSTMSTPWSLKPYRDYAIRIEGEALHCINQNFVEGWDAADGYFLANGAPASGRKLRDERIAIQAKDLPRPAGARCRAQVLRTFPDRQDATILKAYTLASANALNYIYVENQYFQLAEWPRLIKKQRELYCRAMAEAGAKPSDITPLHVFVVTPQPERAGMVPRTYDSLSELGQGQVMGGYDRTVQGQRKAQAAPAPSIWGVAKGSLLDTAVLAMHPTELPAAALKEAARRQVVQESIDTAPANPVADLNALGVRTLAAMLMTYDTADEAKNLRIRSRDNDAQEAAAAQEERANADHKLHGGKANDVELGNVSDARIVPGRYREIYIHSKLMFVDDVYTTLGSANLNARSMVGDSELNICTEEWAFTREARRRVWGNLAGEDLDGGSGSRQEVSNTFNGWTVRMTLNRERRANGTSPLNKCFLQPLEDPRTAPVYRLA